MGRGEAIGILGGMGTRATWRFCEILTGQLETELAINKEWEFPEFQVYLAPHVPSRTRALLYREESPVDETALALSAGFLKATKLIAVPCNSIHYWREEILKNLSYQREWVDMISCVKKRAQVDEKTLVIGGWVTMVKALYGEAIYPLSEYDLIADYLEKLRRGYQTDISKLINTLYYIYQPNKILLACTELDLDRSLRSVMPGMPIPILSSAKLYATEVARQWKSRLRSS